MSAKKKIQLTPWGSFEVGGISKKDLALSIDHLADDTAKEIMESKGFLVYKKPRRLEFVILTPRQLGATGNEHLCIDYLMSRESCAVWSAFNLDGQAIELCVPEDGPQICRQRETIKFECSDQDGDNVVWMAGLIDMEEGKGVFTVQFGKDNSCRLSGQRISVGGSRKSPLLKLNSKLLFCLRKSVK